MTIRHPGTFHRRPPAGFDGVFDWEWLTRAFGGRIAPMDFDAVVEIRERFLVLETKGDGVPIPEGQRICLEAVARQPQWTVVIVWGKDEASVRAIEIWRRGRKRRYEGGDAAVKLVAYCERWAAWARGERQPPRAISRQVTTPLTADDIRWD